MKSQRLGSPLLKRVERLALLDLFRYNLETALTGAWTMDQSVVLIVIETISASSFACRDYSDRDHLLWLDAAAERPD